MSLETKFSLMEANLSEPDRETFRQKTQVVLREISDEDAMFNALLDTSANADLRVAICKLLYFYNIDQSVPLLIRLLETDTHHTELRMIACHLLGYFRDERSVDILIDVLEHDRHSDTVVHAVYALGQIADERSIEPLIQAMKNFQEDESVRAEILEAFAYLFARQAIPLIVPLLQDSSPRLRFWAAFALGWLGNNDHIADLEKLISDTNVIQPWGSVGTEAKEAIEAIQHRQTWDHPDGEAE